MSHPPLTGPRVEAKSGTTKSLVIVSHGYGSNGDDLIQLASQWAPAFPDTVFVAPNAPEPCPIAPDGFQWFPLTHNPGGLRSPDEYWNGVVHSEQVLHDFVDRELERYNLDESNCVLVGFSQGTMMSFHVGLHREKQLAGIIGYSGVLAGSSHIKDSIKTKPPVLIVHGEDDPVVPSEALFLSRNAMRTVDMDPEWTMIAGLGHSIDELGLLLGYNFLRRVL